MSKQPISRLLSRTSVTVCLFALLGAGVYARGGPIQHRATRARQGRGPAAGSLLAAYAGFDKNAYPGDDLLPALSKHFAFTGYWLNKPPGMTSSPWLGKRSFVRAQGLGFLLLFNGRLYADLKAAAAQGHDAAALGRSDAATAIAAARQEGFRDGAVIFLDQEEGGHLLPEQAAYLFAWIDAFQGSAVPKPAQARTGQDSPRRSKVQGYRPGVYCSGIAASASDAGTTAVDILQHYNGRRPPTIWVANDQCPPAPGCLSELRHPSPASSGTPAAAIWQYAQSPRRAQITAGCAPTSYAADNGCYAPGLPHSANTAIDLDTATSRDPSHGR